MSDTTSIMMVTFNRLALTKRMIDNFLENTKSNFRLIVVDNGSSDDTPIWLHKNLKEKLSENSYCKSYDLYLNHTNKGIASGRNKALNIATKYNDPYLCTIDNDLELPYNWLAKCVDFLKYNSNFMIGVNLEDVNYPIVIRNTKECQLKERGNLGTACMVFPKQLFNMIGYFTTEYERYGEEDSQYGFRARMTGYELAYLPENGIHFGVGDLDKGEYRKFKDECRIKNINQFRSDCFAFMQNKKSIYYPYKLKE